MIYLGQLGRLVPVRCPSSQTESRTGGYTFMETVEGRVKAQRLQGGRRTWDVGFGDLTTPTELSKLRMFARGDWGPGPFVFVSAEAQNTNMLTPWTAAVDPGLDRSAYLSVVDSPVEVESGIWFPRHLINSNTGFRSSFSSDEMTPVLSGVSVTASAWVQGDGARVRIRFRNTDGTQVGAVSSTVMGDTLSWVRSWVTATPPVGAAYAQIVMVQTTRATGPALTWTDSLVEWSEGQGCAKAVVDQVNTGLVFTAPSRTYSNASFVVKEVG